MTPVNSEGQGVEQRVAGRPLDAAVAERACGFVWRRSGFTNGREAKCSRILVSPENAARYRPLTGDEVDAWALEQVPYFSLDIDAAFQVVEAMAKRAQCWWLTLTRRSYGTTKENYVVGGWSAEFRSVAVAFCAPDVYAEAPTPTVAICLAALKALDAEDPPSSRAVDPLPSSPSDR